MKIAVKVWFEFDSRYVNSELVEFDHSPHFMDWEYPILPKVGEYICNPAQFLSDREKEVFESIKLKDFHKQFNENIHINLNPIFVTCNVMDYGVCLQAKVHQSHLSVLYFKPS